MLLVVVHRSQVTSTGSTLTWVLAEGVAAHEQLAGGLAGVGHILVDREGSIVALDAGFLLNLFQLAFSGMW